MASLKFDPTRKRPIEYLTDASELLHFYRLDDMRVYMRQLNMNASGSKNDVAQRIVEHNKKHRPAKTHDGVQPFLIVDPEKARVPSSVPHECRGVLPNAYDVVDGDVVPASKKRKASADADALRADVEGAGSGSKKAVMGAAFRVELGEDDELTVQNVGGARRGAAAAAPSSSSNNIGNAAKKHRNNAGKVTAVSNNITKPVGCDFFSNFIYFYFYFYFLKF